MALKPLDMQIVLSQIDNVGLMYLREYQAPRKHQMYYNALYEKRTKSIDGGVSYIREGLNASLETYFDAHDNKLYKIIRHTKRQRLQEIPLQKDPSKGNLVDFLG